MKNKLLSLMVVMSLVVSMTLGVTGCGSKSSDSDKKVLKVAFECAYAPYNWTQESPEVGNGKQAVKIKNADGYAYGYEVELAQRIADEMGYELVDVCLDKENTGKFLRIYVDRPEGMSLDDCERYHRAIMPLVESYDFDFLEVSSPGIDRPLKKDRDFERALGEEVEVHLFKAVDGQKVFTGILSDFDAQDMVLTIAGEEKRFARKAASLVKPVVDMEGVENVDLGEE